MNKDNVRKAFARKQQLDHWHDEDLLYALCAVCKRLDLVDQGEILVSPTVSDRRCSDTGVAKEIEGCWKKGSNQSIIPPISA